MTQYQMLLHWFQLHSILPGLLEILVNITVCMYFVISMLIISNTISSGNCQGVIQYLGDGYCDDANNVADCSYDYGDCCLENVITDYCSICECIEGKTKWISTTSLFTWPLFQSNTLIQIFFYIGNETTTQLPLNDFSECFYGDYILDHFDNGICNDVLNTPKCLFDGGDCCDGDTNDNSTCLTCFCFEEVNTFGNINFC